MKMEITAVNSLELWNNNKEKWNTKKDLDKVKVILINDFNIKEITDLKRIGLCSFTLNGINNNKSFSGY